jgi:hypothetical protein
MAASDLATLTDVKTWLSGSSGIGTSDDALIARLITDVSGAITAYLGRPSLTPRTFMERHDGNDKTRLFLRHYPVLGIISLLIDMAAVPPANAAAEGPTRGYFLEAWCVLAPVRPKALDVFRAYYRKGRQNIMVDYTAGYAVEGETATVPLAPGPYNVSVAAPFGPWAVDLGVTYAGGTPLSVTSGSPAAAYYNVSGGTYTFAAADAGANILISYGFIPAAVNNACIEWVAERYRYRTRIGQSAQTVQGQQTASYSLKDIPDFIRASLDPFRSVVAV